MKSASASPLVAQASKPAVSRISKSAYRCLFERLQIPSPPSTPPTPIRRLRAQLRQNGIPTNLAPSPLHFRVVTNPVIIRLRLPERFRAQPQNRLRPSRCELLPRFHDLTQQMVWQRTDDHMNMVRHHNPIIEPVSDSVKKTQRSRYQPHDLGSSQMARARALIKIPFDLPTEFAPGIPLLTLLRIAGGRLVFKKPDPIRPIGIKAQKPARQDTEFQVCERDLKFESALADNACRLGSRRHGRFRNVRSVRESSRTARRRIGGAR